MKKKIMVVFGTRPEAIKMAPVVHALQEHDEYLDILTCVTAQHRDMLDQVLSLFNINADYDLNIMTRGQDLYDISAKVILGMRDILENENPDLVLVHGDTTTSTMAALAAFYQQIPVGHVEAGLRSSKRYSPFPEEMNRCITAQLASWHFAPTRKSRNNLLSEGVAQNRVLLTGNTAIDALVKANASIKDMLSPIEFSPGTRGLLVTAHRRENFGAGIQGICMALLDLIALYPDIEIIYPVHPNPNIKETVHALLSKEPRIRLTDPVGYQEFVDLMSNSYLILSDSGGVQEEAPSLGKPVLVLRDCTERPEAIEAGTVALVGTDRESVVSSTARLLDDSTHYKAMTQAVNPYGDGLASTRIASHILNTLILPAHKQHSISWFDPITSSADSS